MPSTVINGIIAPTTTVVYHLNEVMVGFFSPVILVFWAITVGIITIRAANSGIFTEILDVLSWDDIVDLHCWLVPRNYASFNQNKNEGPWEDT